MSNKPIIVTDFISNICFDLHYAVHSMSIIGHPVTASWLSDNFNLVVELIKQDVARIHEDIANCNDDEEIEFLYDELHTDRLFLVDLNILAELEGVNYAHPDHISNSISILSEKLTAQLDAKAHHEATYDSCYCKRIAECLKELCEMLV